jgi:ribonuclease HII
MSTKLRVRALRTNGPDFSFEKLTGGNACGLDEVGRAPVAGPVVAACVFIPAEHEKEKIWNEVNDSKLLSAPKRQALSLEIQKYSVWAIAESSVEEVETVNIVQASFLAMRRAYLQCFPRESGENNLENITALIDGHIVPRDFPCTTQAIIKGDTKSVSIAAASIIAKVYRDELMARLAQEHPHYGWEHNAGYPTKKHLNGIQAYGVTPHHRKTFAPVRNYLEFGQINPQMKLAV